MLLTLTCGTGRGNPGAPRCSHTACAACRKQDSVHMQSGFQLDSVSSAVPPRLLRKWAEWALSRPSVLLGCQARLRRRTSAAVGPTAQHGLPVPRARFTPPPPKKDATTHIQPHTRACFRHGTQHLPGDRGRANLLFEHACAAPAPAPQPGQSPGGDLEEGGVFAVAFLCVFFIGLGPGCGSFSLVSIIRHKVPSIWPSTLSLSSFKT